MVDGSVMSVPVMGGTLIRNERRKCFCCMGNNDGVGVTEIEEEGFYD